MLVSTRLRITPSELAAATPVATRFVPLWYSSNVKLPAVNTFSATVVGVLVEASEGAAAQLESVDVAYPELELAELRTFIRQPVVSSYCEAVPGFPCEVDADCGTSEDPQHEVTVPAFIIERTEVTAADWNACVADGDCCSNKCRGKTGKKSCK